MNQPSQHPLKNQQKNDSLPEKANSKNLAHSKSGVNFCKTPTIYSKSSSVNSGMSPSATYYFPNLNNIRSTPKTGSNLSQREFEELKDQINKIKADYNNKVKEIHDLKIGQTKLDKDNALYIKLIEKILSKSLGKDKGKKSSFNSLEEINDAIECKNFNNKKEIKEMNDTYRIMNLKKHITGYKKSLEQKESELQSLKKNSKCAKLTELSKTLRYKEEIIFKMKRDNEELCNKILAAEKRSSDLSDIISRLKSINHQNKTKLQDYESIFSNQMETIENNKKEKLRLEEKISRSNSIISDLKNKIKEKDSTISELNSDISRNEQYKQEKDNYDKNEQSSQKKIKNLMHENEKLHLKISQLEKENQSLQEKLTTHEKTKSNPKNNSDKSSDKIKSLEEQNDHLLNENLEYESKFKVLNEKYTESIKKQEELQKEKEDVEKRNKDLDGKIKEYENKILELEERCKKVEKEEEGKSIERPLEEDNGEAEGNEIPSPNEVEKN